MKKHLANLGMAKTPRTGRGSLSSLTDSKPKKELSSYKLQRYSKSSNETVAKAARMSLEMKRESIQPGGRS